MNTSAHNYNSSANHNLSSLLSQIQDNGPAYADLTRQKNTRSFMPEENIKRDKAVSQAQPDEQYNDDTLSLSSGGMQDDSRNKAKNAFITKKEISPGVWLQLLLVLISAALLASTLFRLDAQTNTIENSLNDYDEIIDEKIQESVDYQKKNSVHSTTKLKAALQSLQKELLNIKTDYSALDKKYVEMAQTKSTDKAQHDVSAYKSEILSLKNELQSVKTKLQVVNSAKNSVTEITASNGLIVNLASLSNRNKAEKIVQQLYAEGLLPTMKQAIVNGERVYRLSVGGFVNRDEAELFIRKASEKYGMNDSRIRKS